MNSALHSLWKRYLAIPYSVTITAIALPLGVFIIVFLWLRPAPPPPWYSLNVTTDNGLRPLHLPGPSAANDLLMVQNLSTQPLCLYAFSSRPRDVTDPHQIMLAWARWITVSRQALTIPPNHTWIMTPGQLNDLLTIHGTVWFTCYFQGASQAGPRTATPPTLPDSFTGEFRVYYTPSLLTQQSLLAPQVFRSHIIQVLSREIDSTGHHVTVLPPMNIRAINTLTARDLQ